jgi:hypothetical protein
MTAPGAGRYNPAQAAAVRWRQLRRPRQLVLDDFGAGFSSLMLERPSEPVDLGRDSWIWLLDAVAAVLEL